MRKSPESSPFRALLPSHKLVKKQANKKGLPKENFQGLRGRILYRPASQPTALMQKHYITAQ